MGIRGVMVMGVVGRDEGAKPFRMPEEQPFSPADPIRCPPYFPFGYPISSWPATAAGCAVPKGDALGLPWRVQCRGGCWRWRIDAVSNPAGPGRPAARARTAQVARAGACCVAGEAGDAMPVVDETSARCARAKAPNSVSICRPDGRRAFRSLPSSGRRSRREARYVGDEDGGCVHPDQVVFLFGVAGDVMGDVFKASQWEKRTGAQVDERVE